MLSPGGWWDGILPLSPFAWAGAWEGPLTILGAIVLDNAACLLGLALIAAWDRWAGRTSQHHVSDPAQKNNS